jgi:hypothetical protein
VINLEACVSFSCRARTDDNCLIEQGIGSPHRLQVDELSAPFDTELMFPYDTTMA